MLCLKTGFAMRGVCFGLPSLSRDYPLPAGVVDSLVWVEDYRSNHLFNNFDLYTVLRVLKRVCFCGGLAVDVPAQVRGYT